MKLVTFAFLFEAAEVGLGMVIRPNGTITSPTSPSPQPTLSLSASLKPANLTHVEVSVKNTYPQDISILAWNSLFQPGAEHGSFKVTHSVEGTKATLHPGEDVLRLTFTEAVRDDFVEIPAGGQYQGYYDLTRLFKVPAAGNYEVTLDVVIPAFLHSSATALEEKLKEFGIHDLPSLGIRSEAIAMNLAKSEQDLQRRAERFRPGDCGNDPIVENARNNAKDLARRAQGSGNAALWSLYFNNNDQQATVSKGYQGVIDYDPMSNNFGVTEQCDRQKQDFDCRKNERIAAYAAGPFDDGTHIIVFCSTFFALPEKLTCEYPSVDFRGMLDQGGTFLHELLHVESLAGVVINDGKDKTHGCYSWNCITNAAKPDNGGEDRPWLIAKSYEAYAYAARALNNRGCAVDEAKVTAGNDGSLNARIANVNNECAPDVASCTFDNFAIAGVPE
ncbi:MAG: hypothetical protein Q9168_003886 [Polycauliona sp. 1 TL-2023]